MGLATAYLYSRLKNEGYHSQRPPLIIDRLSLIVFKNVLYSNLSIN